MTAQVAADLRAAAHHIATRLVVSDSIDAYYVDRDLDADSLDVFKALKEAADRIEADQ